VITKGKSANMTRNQLLERAGEFDLDEGVLLTTTTVSAHKGTLKGWIISSKDYLLSRDGWRLDRRGDDMEVYGQILQEEWPYDAEQFVFADALGAANFYESRCTGEDVKPAFDLRIARLRDYLGCHFAEQEWKAATESALTAAAAHGSKL
jgi:hypothetical protein